MTVRLYTEQDLLELTDEQARRLVAAGLAYPNQSLSGIDDEDGTLRAAWIFAVPGYDLADLQWASRWMAQLPDANGVVDWVAVSEHETEDDWFADTDADGEAHRLPSPRVRDLYDLPESGRLKYVVEGRGLVERLIGDTVFHVTVLVVTEHTYRVSALADGVADEDAAEEFIKSADIETLDDHQIHEETVSTKVSMVETVDESPVRAALTTCEPGRHRPDDDPTPGDRCKDCGRELTWRGPSQTDWDLA